MSDDKQATANAEIEKEYAAMIKAEGTDKKSTPEYKVSTALKTAQKALDKAVDIVQGDNKLSALVDIDKLAKLDVQKYSKVKEEVLNTDALANKTYTGTDIAIYQWQHAQIAKPVRKSSGGGSSLFNIVSETAKPTAERIIQWVRTNANRQKKDIKKAVATLINEVEYKKYITVKDEDSKADQLKKLESKIELIVAKLSGPESNLKGIKDLGAKLTQDGGKYKVQELK